MIDGWKRTSLSAFLVPVQEPQIVLAALTRLRWLAVVGQITATAVATWALRVRLPLAPIAGLILLTALSNVVLVVLPQSEKRQPWLIPLVLLLDVFLLTSLLYLTGGPQNPFAALYLIHVAMAVIVLRPGWTWIVVAAVGACYGIVLAWHLPLGDHPLPRRVLSIGNWIALVLMSVILAAFIGRVIWSLRQREHELAVVRERAGRSEQLAALTTLAAGAAHELNTPLGTIAVVARELERSCEPTGAPDVLEDARLIRREVDRCRAILSRMRVDIGEDVSHRSTLRLFDLESHLRENLRDGEGDRLTVSSSPDVQTVHAPARALEQALLVLLRNAFDASPPRSPVLLDIHPGERGIRFEVRDRGPGMSPDLLRRAGQPFFTTKDPGRGMGLGLFLVRLVAQQCGATFSVDSTPGAGTTCVLELGAAAAHNTPDDRAPTQDAATVSGSR